MKKTILFCITLFTVLFLLKSCRNKEFKQPQSFTQKHQQEESESPEIIIDSVTNKHEDAEYQYEYRTGESGDYQYNYDVKGTDNNGNKVTGNINVEGKYGKGTLKNLDGKELEITTEWIGLGRLTATDIDGDEYELVVE